MVPLISLILLISGCASQDAIYKNVCKTIVERFDCSHGFDTKNICGTDGTIYYTECDFAISHCRDYSLGVNGKNTCDGSKTVSNMYGYQLPSTPAPSSTPGLSTTTGQGSTVGRGSTVGQGSTMGQISTLKHGPTVSQATSTVAVTTVSTTSMPTTTLSSLCMVLVSASCPTDKTEVCGTDKETYDNMCHFEKAKCHKPSIAVDHNGICKLNAVDIICKTVKEKSCPDDTEIVCGNDGHTYQNLCEFDKGRCGNPGLKLASLGKC